MSKNHKVDILSRFIFAFKQDILLFLYHETCEKFMIRTYSSLYAFHLSCTQPFTAVFEHKKPTTYTVLYSTYQNNTQSLEMQQLSSNRIRITC